MAQKNQQSEPEWIPTHVLTDAQLNDAGIIRGGPQKPVETLE